MSSPLRVLIIGASGVFGSRLTRLAARESGIIRTVTRTSSLDVLQLFSESL